MGHCSCNIFVLTSYSLYTKVMLILILTNIQYLQNVNFSFKKGSNGQNHSSSESCYPIKKFWKTLMHVCWHELIQTALPTSYWLAFHLLHQVLPPPIRCSYETLVFIWSKKALLKWHRYVSLYMGLFSKACTRK